MQAMQATSSSQSCLLSSHEFPCSNTKFMCRAAQQKGNETKGQSYRPCRLNVDHRCSKPHDKHFCWRLTSKHSTSYTPLPHITSMLFDQQFHFSQGKNPWVFRHVQLKKSNHGLGYLRISQPFAFVSSEKSDL